MLTLFSVAGALLVLVVLADVFFTVLFPASGRGPLRKPLSRLLWALLSSVARPLRRRQQRALLAYSGPLQIAMTVTVWVGLLVIGWALLYWPVLGREIRASSGSGEPDFAGAVYFSGFNLTTLGTGDLVAVSGAYRILTVVEAAIGFSTFTLVLTYFLSVYSAQTARRTFASHLHHRTRDTGRSAELALDLLAGGPGELSERAAGIEQFLTNLRETHRSYPVLRYFHHRSSRYSVPRMLFLVLDAAALLQASGAVGGSLEAQRALHRLVLGADELLDDLSSGDRSPREAGTGQRERWRWHAEEALATLREHTSVPARPRECMDRYARHRQAWNSRLQDVTAAMVYPWDEVEPPPQGGRSHRRSEED